MTYNEFKRWFEPLQTFYRKQARKMPPFRVAVVHVDCVRRDLLEDWYEETFN